MASSRQYQQPYTAGRSQHVPSSRQQQKHIDRAEVVTEEETFEETSERERAAEYLESTELLMWLANSRNESVPQTRHHYERVMAGFRSDEPDTSIEWEDVYEPTESDIERLTPRSTSTKTAKGKSSGASTPTVAGSSRGDGGSGVGKKRKSGEGGQRKRKSGGGGGA